MGSALDTTLMSRLQVLGAGNSEDAGVSAATSAARAIAVELPVDTSVAITIVSPSSGPRNAFGYASRPIQSSHLIEIVERIRADPILVSIAADAAPSRRVDSSVVAKGIVLARTANGIPIAFAMQ